MAENVTYIYATPGTTFQSYEPKRNELNGDVLVPSERPTPHSICIKTGDGIGEWVEPRWLKAKAFKSWIILKYNREKVAIRIFSPILVAIAILLICILLLQYKPVSDTFKLIDPLIGSILLSLLVALIVYMVTTVYLRNKRMSFESARVYRIVAELASVKNYQYINLGYLTHWAEKGLAESFQIEVDYAMTAEKSKKITSLMKSKFSESQKVEKYDQILFGYYPTKATDKYPDYFTCAHKFFRKKIDELQTIITPELFPKFYEALILMQENLNRPSYHPLLKPHEYEVRHFRFIEMIECLYEYECKPYLGFKPAHHNITLQFSEDFKKMAYRPQISYFG